MMEVKRYFFMIIFLAGFTTTTFTQISKRYYKDVFYFIKEVDIKNMGGKHIQLSISVKAKPADSLSSAKIYAVQKRKGYQDFITGTLQYATETGTSWKTYSISSTIDTSAKTIWLYCAVNGNGDFYFDDVKIYMEDDNGLMQLQEIVNPSFESNDVLKGYLFGKEDTKGISYFWDKKTKLLGKQSLHVRTLYQKVFTTE